MTPLSRLWDLREEVKFWNYKVETSYPQNAAEMIYKLYAAKYKLKLHKQLHFPELLEQPKRETIPYVMLADLTEEFENLNY